uniref:Oligopeptidase B n=1 Tax=Panagrellus redivivus TaxID=6233 RepID=A0A7E4W3N3_PANRE
MARWVYLPMKALSEDAGSKTQYGDDRLQMEQLLLMGRFDPCYNVMAVPLTPGSTAWTSSSASRCAILV